MKKLTLLIVAIVLTGCLSKKLDFKTSDYSPQIEIGSTPEKVVKVMGTPEISTANVSWFHRYDADSVYLYISDDSLITEVNFLNGYVNSISISAHDTSNRRKLNQYIDENFQYLKKESLYSIFIDEKDPSSSKYAVVVINLNESDTSLNGITYASYYNIKDCDYTKNYIKE